MGFYTVWIRSTAYRGVEPLTYQSDLPLARGAIVKVPLQDEAVLGFVEKQVGKPPFPTKSIERIYDFPSLPAELVELGRWMQEYYASSVGVVTTQLLPATLAASPLDESIVVQKSSKTALPPLTSEQKSVVESITKSDTYLLHGRTGSGKTRVYVELAMRAIQSGHSVMILTPEISLTSQLSQTFQNALPDQVVILHSRLTVAQRQKAWKQVLTSTRPLVALGPRSVLFSPLHNIGLIVIDEAHEPAYKQEQAPYYHARTVASKLAQLYDATFIIGSATPSITDYYLAAKRKKPILTMTALAQPSDKEMVTKIVDLKDRSLFSRSQHLSDTLIGSIRTSLARHEQSLVYLNRRGTARIVLCDNCGWQALCPHCDLPLVYHADTSRFRCHTCGYSQPILINCPVCNNPSITFKSVGTKALADELERIFPEAKTQRFDADNKKSERFEEQYAAIREGSADILVGTQMLAKGLDLPRLSTLGIVLAESSLYLPDFSAQERTYQLLSQALGRVGRGHTAGQAIVQTYHPESRVLQAAVEGNWQAFYEAELSERQKFHFPPFYHLLKLTNRRATYASAEAAAHKLKRLIEQQVDEVEVDGPAPAFHEKSQGKYHCQLVIKSRHRNRLLAILKLLPGSGWTYDIDPVNLL